MKNLVLRCFSVKKFRRRGGNSKGDWEVIIEVEKIFLVLLEECGILEVKY